MGKRKAGSLRRFFSLSNSMKTRLILYFLLIILLPTLIISISTYTISQRIIRENSIKTMENSLNVIETSILSELASIDDLSTAIYTNAEMVELLSAPKASDRTSMTTEVATLDRLLDGFNTGYQSQDTIRPNIYMFNRPEYLQYNFSDRVFDVSRIEKEDWYKNLPIHARYTIVGYKPGDDTIKIAKRLFALRNAEVSFSGILTIDVSASRFRSILQKLTPSRESDVYILDCNGAVIISSNSGFIGSGVADLGLETSDNTFQLGETRSYADGDNFVSTLPLSGIGWCLLVIAPASEFNSPLEQFSRVLFIVIAVSLGVGILLALALAETFAHPIRNIVQSMDTVKEGQFDVVLEYPHKDEFRYLIDNYQQMLVDLQQMIDRLYVSEANKRAAELKALQAQINPHFLYNTLDSINWLALKNGAPDISLMVTSLSDFFRFSVSQEHDLIPLSDEIQQLKSYLTIQKIRFIEKLDYTIQMPEELGDYLIIKMLLQPIVENSVLHGVEKRSGEEIGTILVSVEKQGDELVILIADDGAGADVEKLNRMLRTQDKPGGRHGAKNVHNRIRYYFGEAYGLVYEENFMGGITARIVIPSIHKAGNERGIDYDPHGDSGR